MSGRRRGSKWDLTQDISPEKCRDNGRSSKAGSSFHEYESREYLSGRRGYHRNEHINEENMAAWERDGRHDTARMSPGLDGWRRKNRSRSPRSSHGRSQRSRSRSRSHSPARNPRKEPGFNDRNNRSGISAQICRDFAAGSCRKGDLCHFAHHSSPSHDRGKSDRGNGDGWESRHSGGPLRHASSDYHSIGRRSAPVCNSFLVGRCRKGASCKYAHHDAGSNEFGKELMDEFHEDGHGDWRGRGGRSYDCDRELHKGSETMCRFFVAGNCRNGKYCKYSHHQEELLHHEGRSLGERRLDHNRNDMDEVWDSPKWTNNTCPPRSSPDAHLQEEERSKIMDSATLRDVDWSNYNYIDKESAGPNHLSHGEALTGGDDKMMLSSKEQSLQRKGDAVSIWDAVSISESKGGENFFTDRATLSPNGIFKPRIGIAAQKSDSLSFSQMSVPNSEQDIARGASSDNHYVGRFMQPNISDDYSHINPSFGNVTAIDTGNNTRSFTDLHLSSNILPGQSIHQMDESVQSISNSSAAGQSQTYQIHPKVGEGVQMSHSHSLVDAKPKDVSYVGNANLLQATTRTAPPGHTSVLSEQLAQFSQLSTTLAHLLEKRQHLISQQSASNDCRSSLPPESGVAPVPPPPASSVSFQPNQASGSMRLYDPICDSLESKPPQSVEQTNSGLGTSEIPSSTSMLTLLAPSGPIVGSSDNGLGPKNKDLTEEGNVTVSKGQNNGVEGRNKEQDNRAHDDADVEGSGVDDEKKTKDSKSVRAFKFALAEFVKELLKPTWKDGQVSKQVYKTIVKKVVDKVTDTLQAAQIPRTKEKINQYLAFLKPKLSKLVQGYVEKYQKA